MLEHRALEPLEFGPRIDPQLLDQLASGRIELAQRLRLPARTVQGHHELRSQPLTQRVLGDELAQCRDDQLVPAEHQPGVDLVFERRGAQLVEAVDLGHGELLVGDVLKGFTSPQRQRRAQLGERRGRVVVPVFEPFGGRVHQPVEPVHVDPVGIDIEHVASGDGAKRWGRARWANPSARRRYDT